MEYREYDYEDREEYEDPEECKPTEKFIPVTDKKVKDTRERIRGPPYQPQSFYWSHKRKVVQISQMPGAT